MRNIKSVKKYRAALLLTIGMLHASGCASTELEQRSFPLAVGIDLQRRIMKSSPGKLLKKMYSAGRREKRRILQ